MNNTPAISVVIPMYNAAKYVGECLESILAQTFQDFEVIIVDDCSTDSSCEIVESYAPKFNGRLMLLQLDRNTGSGAVPRNVGLKIARGEYVFFADADDLLMLTALEELYTLAKKFDAEVVYCEKCYEASIDLGKIYIKDIRFISFVDVPTFDTDDFAVRVRKLLEGYYEVTPWRKLVRRDLLIEHELFFPPCKIAEDDIWTYELVFFAKKFLRIPNLVYVWRQTQQSVLRKKKSPQETINFWVNPIITGLKTLGDNLCKPEFFRQNPQCLYAILEHLVHGKIRLLFDASSKLSLSEIYTAIKDEFGKNLGVHDVLVSWLLTDLITKQKILVADQKRIAELEQKIKENFS